MIKSLKRNDIRSTPFVANKSWNSQNQTFDNTISWQSGSQSGSLFLSFVDYKDGTQLSLHSSSIAYQQQDPDFLRFRIGQEITGTTFYPTSSKYYDSSVNPTNIDGTYQGLVYNTLKNLFYKETANPTQIFGLESLNPVDVNRTLTKQINVFNVPQNKFGEKIVPNSIEIKQQLDDGHFVVIDDGNTNLKLSGSHFVDVQNAMYNCVSAIINVTDTSYTYNGSPKSASVTTNPSDLITITTYNGSETPPTDVGTYTILSTIWDGYYCGSTGSTFIINKATATITVTNVVATYDGNPHYTTATTTPSDLSYTIVYTLNGETILDNKPIDVGVYTATATVDDGNYTVTGIGTVTINPPTLTVNFAAIADRVYGTTTITLIASSSPFSYPIKYTITSGDNLAKIPDTSKTEILLSPTLTATSLGTVTVKAETTDLPTGFTSAYATRTFNVTPKLITLDVNQIIVTYPGSGTNVSIDNTKLNNWLVSQNPSQLVTKTDKVTISGPNAGTIPNSADGTYIVTLGSPYTLGGTHAAKYSLLNPEPIINFKLINVKTITLNDPTFTYDGSPYTIKDIISKSFATLVTGITYTIEFLDNKSNTIFNHGYKLNQVNDLVGPTNVGNYTVKITNKDVSSDTKTAKLTINRAEATIVLGNLIQGGVKTTGYNPVYTFSSASFGVYWSQKNENGLLTNKSSTNRNSGLPDDSSLIPTTFAENITDITVTGVTIKDRNGNPSDLLASKYNNLYKPNITYVGGKPSAIGNFWVEASLLQSLSNVYGSLKQQLTISDFYYITTSSLYVNEYGYNGYTTQSVAVGKYYDRTTLSSEIRSVIKKSGHNLKLDYTLVGGGGGGSGETNTKFIPTTPTNITPYDIDVAYRGGGAAGIHLSWSFAPGSADTDKSSPVYYNDIIKLVAGKKGVYGSVLMQMAQGYGSQDEVFVYPATAGDDSYIGIHYTGFPLGMWGSTNYGQSKVPDILIGVRLKAMASGKLHSIVVTSDGKVVAWGGTAGTQDYVPDWLTDVVTVAGGHSHTMALRSDGTVVAWGDNSWGQTNVPSGKYNAIAVGGFHSLALKSDDTLEAWGYNAGEFTHVIQGQGRVPAGLTGVKLKAISAGGYFSVALKSDGTVVAWGQNDYGQTTVPDGLTGVTAIAGGGYHGLALKSDGTVVTWGRSSEGQTTVPAGLTGVTAIAAGSFHTVALKSDGTVVAWGSNASGQLDVPLRLTGVTAIAAGFSTTMAMTDQRWLGLTAGGSGGARGYSMHRISSTSGWNAGSAGLLGKAYFENSEKKLADVITSNRLQYYVFDSGDNGMKIDDLNFINDTGKSKYGGGSALVSTTKYPTISNTSYMSLGGDGNVGSVIIRIDGIHRIYKNTSNNVIHDTHPELEYQ